MGLKENLLSMSCCFDSPTCQAAEKRYFGIFSQTQVKTGMVDTAGNTLAKAIILPEVRFPIEPKINRPPLKQVQALVKNPMDIHYDYLDGIYGERNAIIKIPGEDGYFLAKPTSFDLDDIDAPWVIRRPIISESLKNDGYDYEFLLKNIGFFL